MDGPLFNRRFLAWFAVGLCSVAMLYVAAITFAPIPPANLRYADTVLGFILGTVMSTPIGFFYGSSKSTQSTTQALIAQVTPPTQPPQEPAP